MTAPLTMNRVIHAAVRRDLGRLSEALESARDRDTARARDLQRAYANLHAELKHHHEQEDRHVFPALTRLGVDTALLEDMDTEHQAMSDALTRTAAAMEQYAGTGSASDATAARVSLKETRVVVDRHLLHEEGELEPLLQPHLESAEWKEAERQLRKGPPTTLGRFFAWLTDGMSVEHRAFLRSTVPAPVVTVLAKVFGRRYYKDVAPVWRG